MMAGRGCFWFVALVSLSASLFPAGTIQAQSPSSDLLEERPCGPDWLKGPIRYLIPQGYGNTDFRPACRAHDNCYEVPNKTQKECDDAYLAQMLSACERNGSGIGCRLRARLMYTATRLFGATSYANGQRIGAERARTQSQGCVPCQGTVIHQP